MYRRMSCLPPGCLHGRLCDCVGGRTDPACIDRSMYESQAQVVIKVQKPHSKSQKSKVRCVASTACDVMQSRPSFNQAAQFECGNERDNEATKQRRRTFAYFRTSFVVLDARRHRGIQVVAASPVVLFVAWRCTEHSVLRWMVYVVGWQCTHPCHACMRASMPYATNCTSVKVTLSGSREVELYSVQKPRLTAGYKLPGKIVRPSGREINNG